MGRTVGQRVCGSSRRGKHTDVDVRFHRTAEQGGCRSQRGPVHRCTQRRGCTQFCFAQHYDCPAHLRLLGRPALLFCPPHPEHLRAETAHHGCRRNLSAHRIDGTDNEYPPRPSVHLRLWLGNSRGRTCHLAVRSHGLRHLPLQAPGEKALCSEGSLLSFR